MKRVDFLIAGVQKAATSTLFEVPPGILICSQRPEKKGITSMTKLNMGNPDYERYHAFWSEGASSRKRFEATPIYTYWPPSRR